MAIASGEGRVQLRGMCQCCGRQQAVVRGCMSKHGYEVKEGWFQGVCSGENFQPMQVSRAQADAIITSVRKECEELRSKRLKVLAGEVRPARAKSGNRVRVPSARGGLQWEDEKVAFVHAPSYYQDEAVKEMAWSLQRRAEIGESFANDLERIADEYYGKELLEVPMEAGPAPIEPGERRVGSNGRILVAQRLERGRVYWKDEKGFGSWSGSQAWRKLPVPPVA